MNILLDIPNINAFVTVVVMIVVVVVVVWYCV